MYQMMNLLKILATLIIARRFPRLFQAGMAAQVIRSGVRRL
jgi:hypothetical protein